MARLQMATKATKGAGPCDAATGVGGVPTERKGLKYPETYEL